GGPARCGRGGTRRLRRRRRGCGCRRVRPGHLPRGALRRALQPRSGDARLPGEGRVRLHAIVDDLETARAAVEGGATVVQLRRKGATTDELVEAGRSLRELAATFVVNDDVEAAIQLEA